MPELRQGTWADMAVGVFVQAPNGDMLEAIDARDGWFLMRGRDGTTTPVAPQPADLPVTFIVPTETEAEQLLSETLGAVVLGRLEALAAQPARAARFADRSIRDLFAVGQPSVEGHLHLAHGTSMTDMIGKPKWMQRVALAHQALHDDPTHLMRIPHHHREG